MSTHHRTVDHATESTPSGNVPESPLGPSRPDTIPGGTTTLPDRIERARLRARIAALERTLAEHERRHRTVIEGYERVLEERQECQRSGGESGETRGSEEGVLARLAARLPIRGR